MQSIKGEKAEDLTEGGGKALEKKLLEDLVHRHPRGDITILVRSNKAAALVAQWLMEWGIPVITENSLLLNAHPLVAESLALLSFLDSPQDDLNFWTVLTGSIMATCLGKDDKDSENPSLAQLHHWVIDRSKGFLCTAFKDTWPSFWQRYFAPFHGKAGLMTPYDIIQEWYRALKVPQRFPEAETFLRRFLEVIHVAGERGSATLSTFLEYWQINGGDEKAPMPANMDAVRIMTIHKSKGLQFPVVIIPWLSFSQKNEASPVLCQVDDLQVLAPRCQQMGDVYYENQAQSALEAINLFYVPCTRAEKELHLFHTHTPTLLKTRNLP